LILGGRFSLQPVMNVEIVFSAFVRMVGRLRRDMKVNVDIDQERYEEYIKSLEGMKKNPTLQALVSIFSEDVVDPKKIEDLIKEEKKFE